MLLQLAYLVGCFAIFRAGPAWFTYVAILNFMLGNLEVSDRLSKLPLFDGKNLCILPLEMLGLGGFDESRSGTAE